MKKIVYLLMVLMLVTSASAATLHGEIYDLELRKVANVLVEIDTVPKQQYLARTGEYSFEVPPGEYILKASEDELVAVEKIKVKGDGEFVFDLFLFPSFEDEDEFLSEVDELKVEEEKTGFAKYPIWSYLMALGIFLFAMGRIILARKKYPRKKKKKVSEAEKEENKVIEKEAAKEEKVAVKTMKEEILVEDSGELEKALEIIKQHDGRIYQKELRKEMIYLSEAKISLILTELEHKGQIKKIKKGRGNVILLNE